MDNVKKAAQITDSAVYKPMKGYKTVKMFFGESFADKLSLMHKKAWINRMMRLDAVIYNNGMAGFKAAGPWYAMELDEIARFGKYGYKLVVNIF